MMMKPENNSGENIIIRNISGLLGELATSDSLRY